MCEISALVFPIASSAIIPVSTGVVPRFTSFIWPAPRLASHQWYLFGFSFEIRHWSTASAARILCGPAECMWGSNSGGALKETAETWSSARPEKSIGDAERQAVFVKSEKMRGSPCKSLISFLDPGTSIWNNARRAGRSFLPPLYRRLGLVLGLARDTAHSFVGRFQNPSARAGHDWMSIVSSG